ncbi:MAG: KOW domain-containing RNA-binding protein [Oscillospiraceae bacterium]|nr:KOW domain-containing RNA-binding protein [Oscillospiraceae bacterium]
MNLEIGTVVKSLKGRDKDKYFCVVGAEDNYVFICDGKERKLQKPKRKKIKHVQITNTRLQTETLQVDKHINKAIKSLNTVEE